MRKLLIQLIGRWMTHSSGMIQDNIIVDIVAVVVIVNTGLAHRRRSIERTVSCRRLQLLSLKINNDWVGAT
jgi:Co/Zn/Cd efflux system component